jgi:uncharacterized damage-inducible protein DinB
MIEKEMVVQEFSEELTLTRKVLMGVPADQLDWTPHEKSMSLGQLATHLAQLPGWTGPVLQESGLNLAELDEEALAPRSQGPKGILELFDKLAADAQKALEKVRESAMEDPWTLQSGETEIFTRPRWAVFRQVVMNHIVHHRAQLGLYLRLLDLPVPPTYGPTADHPQG